MNTHSQQPQNMSNDDIIAIANRIREEENSQLQVRPWKSRNRIAWYVAVPAACLVSFFLGYLQRPSNMEPSSQDIASLGNHDTVYVQVHDTIYQISDMHKPVQPRPITASNPSEPRKIGVSVLEDHIHYDLLASNHNEYY